MCFLPLRNWGKWYKATINSKYSNLQLSLIVPFPWKRWINKLYFFKVGSGNHLRCCCCPPASATTQALLSSTSCCCRLNASSRSRSSWSCLNRAPASITCSGSCIAVALWFRSFSSWLRQSFHQQKLFFCLTVTLLPILLCFTWIFMRHLISLTEDFETSQKCETALKSQFAAHFLFMMKVMVLVFIWGVVHRVSHGVSHVFGDGVQRRNVWESLMGPWKSRRQQQPPPSDTLMAP